MEVIASQELQARVTAAHHGETGTGPATKTEPPAGQLNRSQLMHAPHAPLQVRVVVAGTQRKAPSLAWTLRYC